MKHTPGPWKIEPHIDHYLIRSLDIEGQIVTRIDACISDGNARLIAAAPELLGAAKAAFARFTEDRVMGYHTESPAYLLEQAIAKAEGRE